MDKFNGNPKQMPAKRMPSDLEQKLLDGIEKEHKLAMTDDLTGLHNCRYLREKVIQLQESSHLVIGIMFIDINDFKKVNDTFGHETGNVILVNTANIISKSFRPEDDVIRFGGDEFIVLITRDSKSLLADYQNYLKTTEDENILNLDEFIFNNLQLRLNQNIDKDNQENPDLPAISITIGNLVSVPNTDSKNVKSHDLQKIIDLADKQMLFEKKNKNNAIANTNENTNGAGI